MNTSVMSIFNEQDVTYLADAKDNCTFKVGGKLEYFVQPKTLADFCNYIFLLKASNIKFKVVGNMSNILPSDGLNSGVYISTKLIGDMPQIFGKRITAYAGNSIASVCSFAQKNGLSGLEGLFGIPATIGGAVFNNAGAFGFQISDCLESLLIFTGGKIISVPANYAQLGYRKSIFQDNDDIVLAATFVLKQGDKQQILSKMKEVALIRASKQPNLPSAGSVFKKNGEFAAGFLIEQAGLKGEIYNRAQISDIHANFIVNLGGATSESIKYLIDLAFDAVKQKFNIELEREIEYIGDINENTSRLSYT